MKLKKEEVNLYKRTYKIVIKRMRVKIKIKNKLEDKQKISIEGLNFLKNFLTK